MSLGGSRYYLVKNLQGDVIALADTNGNLVAQYTYDAWGKPLTITDGNGNNVANNATHIANLNPLRYRSYVYDNESGLYYLMSRYYDPTVGRFISPDGQLNLSTMHGCNLYAYCENDPVNRVDPRGTCYGHIYDSNLNSPFSGVKYGYNCGLYGLHVRNPRSVDITDKLNAAMKNNSITLEQYYMQNGWMDSLLYFVEKVKPGGEWDFKSQEEWGLDFSTTYLYDGTKLRYDDIGNIHYGYVGRVIFNTDILLLAGGIVQIYGNTSKWSYWNTNFDDPRDQWAIAFGCNLWDRGAF